ncbi:Putative adhesin [Halogranum gelatinilyticum]|uniref:Putative adhesin n=1 Tax=Halogranum gelatinilyticum TaxID=660521 RepID=A0A1G9R277_9EURY|nr:DUF4097 family beta strand repeat-containing protein [Halogranum gelatinilyticum]SDM17241.1 Putative adhesin [Halogranum gelatinilyticum]
MSRSRRSLLTTGVGLASVALAGCLAPSTETRDRAVRTLDAADTDDLTVANQNGSVRVSTWGEPTVELTVIKRTRADRSVFDDVSVRTPLDGGTRTVAVDYATDRARRRVAVDLVLRVPTSLRVARVETVNGDVAVTGTVGDGSFVTQNGRVTATDIDGFLTLTTSNGTVESTGCTGIDGARTVNGTVDVEILSLRRDVELAAVNGSVEAAVSPSLDADVTVSVSNGTITVEGVDLADVDRSGTRLTGTLGEGGTALELRTTNGTATLRALDE